MLLNFKWYFWTYLGCRLVVTVIGLCSDDARLVAGLDMFQFYYSPFMWWGWHLSWKGLRELKINLSLYPFSFILFFDLKLMFSKLVSIPSLNLCSCLFLDCCPYAVYWDAVGVGCLLGWWLIVTWEVCHPHDFLKSHLRTFIIYSTTFTSLTWW